MLPKLLRPTRFSTRPIEGGVSELYPLDVNGSKQWLLARGNSKNLPVLLILHGGPGFTDIWMSETCNVELEKHFIVVNWDQRGSGKSYDKKADTKLLTTDQFVEDAKSVVDHLLQKFNRDKLFLLGQSWGTVIGWKLLSDIPEKITHYVGVGQVSNMMESELRSYNFALDAAKKDNNIKAIKELKSVTMPAPNDGQNPFKPLMVQRKWLAWYGGMMHGQKKLSAVSKHLMSAKEYSFADILKFNKGMQVSIESLWHELLEINLFNAPCRFEVPITLIIGKYDRTVNSELTEELYNQIESPSKDLVCLEAAHLPNLTQIEVYTHHVINTIEKHERTLKAVPQVP